MPAPEQRIELMARLGAYITSQDDAWLLAKERAVAANPWFTTGNIELAASNIAGCLLDGNKLNAWVESYQPLPAAPKRVGIVMAGNIPMVGFHDLLCGFISGHRIAVKLSSKDTVLMKHLIDKLVEWDPSVADSITIAEMLKGCDAYIATGSNNTARYFEQYFGKYPHIIRRNRTSVAILDGTETEEELSLLADDIFSYFGLGCRNITQVCVPRGYDLTKLMDACNKYQDLIHHHKYKNNYDYYLAIYLLNKVHHLTNGALLMVENEVPFSAVAVLHYRYYDSKENMAQELQNSDDIQCLVGHGLQPFGSTQSPGLNDYADGIDTMVFLKSM